MYDGAPPCDTCEHPAPELEAGNCQTWRLWLTLHRHGRDGMTCALQLGPLLDLARLWGADETTVERVLALERHLWPRLKPDKD